MPAQPASTANAGQQESNCRADDQAGREAARALPLKRPGGSAVRPDNARTARRASLRDTRRAGEEAPRTTSLSG